MTSDYIKTWIKKASNDLKIGQSEFSTESPATDMICFHMQQCVEKSLKAFLVHAKIPFSKTHNIAELIEMCKMADTSFDELYSMKAHELSIYAVEVRYPDDFYMPDENETQSAIDTAVAVRDFILSKLS